jgi:hypothetical protein
MFAGCRAFNQDLSRWTLSSAKKMAFMFSGAVVFNQDLTGGGWTMTSDVETMAGMLKGASSFDGDVSGLSTSGLMVRVSVLCFYLIPVSPPWYPPFSPFFSLSWLLKIPSFFHRI